MATAPTTSSTAIYEFMKEGWIELSCQPGSVRSSRVTACWPPGVAELHYADFLATT